MNKNCLIEEEEPLSKTHYALQEIGITYFSYGLVAQVHILASYFSNKEWGQLYRENHYERTDPLFNGVLFSKFPLIFWDALHTSGKEQKVMMERNEVCGVRSGLTVGLKNNTQTEIIALGSTLTPKEFYGLINEEVSIKNIQAIISTFRNLVVC